MEQINKYPEEYKNTLGLSLFCLKKCGINIFFDRNVSFWKKYWYLIYLSLVLIFHYVSLSVYIVKAIIEHKDLFQEAKLIMLWLITTQVILKVIILLTKMNDIRTIIDQLGCNWRVSGLTDEQLNKKSTNLSQIEYGLKLMYNSAYVVTAMYLMIPLCDLVFRHYILQQDLEWFLPFNDFYPFAVTDWWSYFFNYALQIYCILTTFYIYSGSNILLLILSAYLSNEFILLQEDLLGIKPRKFELHTDADIVSPYDEEKTFGDFVRRHQKVIMLARLLDASFYTLVTIECTFSGINICFFALSARTSLGFAIMASNYAAICVVLMIMFSFCYSSEMLCTSSTGIAQCAYANLWYEADKSYRTNIYFIIMRSQKACSLSSFNYASISLSTFGKIVSVYIKMRVHHISMLLGAFGSKYIKTVYSLLSTTWSYLSLANTFYENGN